LIRGPHSVSVCSWSSCIKKTLLQEMD